MIAIVSAIAQERTAFAELCASRGWACTECDSLRSLTKFVQNLPPKIVLTRHRLTDGYSDDVIAVLVAAGRLAETKVVVLIGAGSSSLLEARQVALGADLVQRDPIRTDVLLEYIAKYRAGSRRGRVAAAPSPSKSLLFAGASIHPRERTLQLDAAVTGLTPRELNLIELLVHSDGHVVTYDSLYCEILGRQFRGDTSNMRVLLNKLASSTHKVGVELRDWVEVIPKSGYRYRSSKREAAPAGKPRRPILSAA